MRSRKEDIMRRTFGILMVTLATAALMAPLRAQTQGDKLRITAFAVNLSNIGTGSTNTVLMEIDRWTTDEQQEELRTALLEQGSDKLLRALQRQPRVGFIRLPTTVGYDLRYARETALPDGGRRISIATDRRIGFWEARNQPRSINYPFTLIEIRVDASGKGEGKLSVATKITYDEALKTITLENYATEPVRLQNVRVEVKK
jgi:hypothetical protein